MNFAKTLFAVMIAQVILAVLFCGGILLIGLAATAGDKADVKDGSYLMIDVYGEIMPYDPPETIAAEIFESKPETLHRILSNLEKAAVDDRIKGVIMKVSSNNSLGRASVEEIRTAIKKVRDNDKVVYAFADMLDRRSLFLASACDSIFMPPVGEVYFVGMRVVRFYLRGTLDKLGIKQDIHKIQDYKSAAEMTLRSDMSPEAKEMATWILDEFWDMELDAISVDRGIEREDLIWYMDHILFTAEKAREAGFIDDTVFWDQLESRLKGEDDEKLRLVKPNKYAKVKRSDVGLKGDKRIAVVHAHGMIGGRSSRIDPALGVIMGHETVRSHLSKAGDNDKVDAIIFRIDSNGGESLASDLIAREVARIREKKPIVVSMVDVAASGGYTISYKATKMVADPMTITGSIGSIHGKMNTSGMYNKIGMTFDWLTKGPNAMFWSPQTSFTEKQRERFVDHHFETFDSWLSDIASERGMSFDDAEKLAHGRVWTGRQAKENGLVDELGGLDRAIAIAKEEAGIPLDEEVTIVHYPKRKGLLSMITSGGGPMAAVNWMAYKIVRHDFAETLRLVTSRNLRLWNGESVE